MDTDIATVLRDIAEQLRVRNEDDQRFREYLIEELRRLNRTLERIYDKEIGGPI